MTSGINPNNINGAYPVAGVDNDSQGFRDNFTNIVNNFNIAYNEITDLQSKVLVKSQLTGTTLSNNLNGTSLSGALVSDFRELEVDHTTVSSSVNLDHSAGHYHKIQTIDPGQIQISFAGFTSGAVNRIRVRLYVTQSYHRLVLPSAVVNGVQYIEEYDPSTSSIGFTQSYSATTPANNVYYFEFLTDDGGATISVQDLTRPGRKSDYLYANLSNSNVTTVTTKTIIDSASAALSNIWVYFPANPVDGHVVAISTNPPITANLRLVSTTGATILGNVTSMSSNSHYGWTYVANTNALTINKWFRTPF